MCWLIQVVHLCALSPCTQINEKVIAPIDDNFSDDELAFLPFYTYFQTMAADRAGDNQQGPQSRNVRGTTAAAKLAFARGGSSTDPVSLGLRRAARVNLRQKSSLWTAIYLASNATWTDATTKQSVAPRQELTDALVWSLETWPVDQIDWTTVNSNRLDIELNPEPDRDNHYGTQSLSILPCNERSQFRYDSTGCRLGVPSFLSAASVGRLRPAPRMRGPPAGTLMFHDITWWCKLAQTRSYDRRC